jgi:hypothetical protein
MTIASLEITVADGRRGRVFAHDAATCEAAAEDFRREFLDESDEQRDPKLKAVFERGVVIASAHAGLGDLEDVVRVYVRPFGVMGRPLFACVLVSRARLEKMLAEAPRVFEGFALQIVDTRHLSSEASELIKAGVEAWLNRIYPTAAPPLLIEPWRDPVAEASVEIASVGTEPKFNDSDPKIGESEPARKVA